MNEFDLIKTYFQPLSDIAFNDDAAVLSVPEGRELVVTSDTLNEGVHFRADDGPEFIAKKSLRANLSDLAAMGAKPFYYQLNLALPEGVTPQWLAAFASALKEDQEEFGIKLSGGDTTRGPLSVSITAMGLVREGRAVRRGGARAGDVILLSGPVGEAVARDYHYIPRPRTDLIEIMQEYAHGAADISDGLVADLGHIAAVSGLKACVELAKIPLFKDTALSAQELLSGGEDYELLIAAAPSDAPQFPGCTVIGTFEAGQGVEVLDESGKALSFAKTGWQHFRA